MSARPVTETLPDDADRPVEEMPPVSPRYSPGPDNLSRGLLSNIEGGSLKRAFERAAEKKANTRRYLDDHGALGRAHDDLRRHHADHHTHDDAAPLGLFVVVALQVFTIIAIIGLWSEVVGGR